jgi:hypothetical protein
MAEAAQFLERSGTVVHMQELRTLGDDPRFQKQVGGFTIETAPREYKGKDGQMKISHDYITFDCEGRVMSQLPNMGDKVRVEFTIGGSFWKKGGRYFNKLRAYKIEITEFAAKGTKPAEVSQEEVDFLDAPDNSDDLPF